MSEQHIQQLRYQCNTCMKGGRASVTWLGSRTALHAECPRCGAQDVTWSYTGIDAQTLGDPDSAKQRERREQIISIVQAIVLALCIRGFVLEAFKIPSPSMEPSLLVGDQLFVKKFQYGIRMPFSKWYPVRFDNLQRGDVVVFLYPENESLNFIKRIVGLPGDEVRIAGTNVYVNGSLLPKELIESPDPQYDRYLESNGPHQYTVQYRRGPRSDDATYRVGPDEVFAIGDNRDNSRDSRFWGGVPFGNLKGRASVVWLPSNCTQVMGISGSHVECNGFRWERFGKWVH